MPADRRPVLVALGAAVRDLRVSRHFSQEDVADLAGLHVTYISGIERGLRNVGFENLQKVAHGLGVDLPTLTATVEAHLGRHAEAR
jgi:transcriptional regulator with XRE-family HTH domain